MPDPLESHRVQARLENAHFLIDICHLSLTDTAVRLSVPRGTLEKELEREAHHA